MWVKQKADYRQGVEDRRPHFQTCSLLRVQRVRTSGSTSLGMCSTAETCPSYLHTRNDGIPAQQGASVTVGMEKSWDKLLGKGPWQETFRTRQCEHEMSPTLRFAKGGFYSKKLFKFIWCCCHFLNLNRCLIWVFGAVSGRLRVFHMVMLSFINYLNACSLQVSPTDYVPGNQFWVSALEGFKSQGEGKEKEAGLSVILIIRKYLLEANRQLWATNLNQPLRDYSATHAWFLKGWVGGR